MCSSVCRGSCALHPHPAPQPLRPEGLPSPVMVLQGGTKSPSEAEGYILTCASSGTWGSDTLPR